jgi:hypothetical protein
MKAGRRKLGLACAPPGANWQNEDSAGGGNRRAGEKKALPTGRARKTEGKKEKVRTKKMRARTQ